MCSAGGPMMLDTFCVDSDTYRCDDCGEEFTYKGKKKAACPKCKSKKVTNV
jgi:predicted Zn-ribbon and HTH transcriptional regulator